MSRTPLAILAVPAKCVFSADTQTVWPSGMPGCIHSKTASPANLPDIWQLADQVDEFLRFAVAFDIKDEAVDAVFDEFADKYSARRWLFMGMELTLRMTLCRNPKAWNMSFAGDIQDVTGNPALLINRLERFENLAQAFGVSHQFLVILQKRIAFKQPAPVFHAAPTARACLLRRRRRLVPRERPPQHGWGRRRNSARFSLRAFPPAEPQIRFELTPPTRRHRPGYRPPLPVSGFSGPLACRSSIMALRDYGCSPLAKNAPASGSAWLTRH